MRLASLLLALALGATLLSPARAASLTRGTLELETSVDFTHTAFTSSEVNSITSFSGSVGGGYSLTPLGRELSENVLPLHGFAERWSKRTK